MPPFLLNRVKDRVLKFTRPQTLGNTPTQGFEFGSLHCVRCTIAAGLILKASQFLYDNVQTLTMNELHGVKMIAAISTNFEHWNDVRVV